MGVSLGTGKVLVFFQTTGWIIPKDVGYFPTVCLLNMATIYLLPQSKTDVFNLESSSVEPGSVHELP